MVTFIFPTHVETNPPPWRVVLGLVRCEANVEVFTYPHLLTSLPVCSTLPRASPERIHLFALLCLPKHPLYSPQYPLCLHPVRMPCYKILAHSKPFPPAPLDALPFTSLFHYMAKLLTHCSSSPSLLWSYPIWLPPYYAPSQELQWPPVPAWGCQDPSLSWFPSDTQPVLECAIS